MKTKKIAPKSCSLFLCPLNLDSFTSKSWQSPKRILVLNSFSLSKQKSQKDSCLSFSLIPQYSYVTTDFLMTCINKIIKTLSNTWIWIFLWKSIILSIFLYIKYLCLYSSIYFFLIHCWLPRTIFVYTSLYSCMAK